MNSLSKKAARQWIQAIDSHAHHHLSMMLLQLNIVEHETYRKFMVASYSFVDAWHSIQFLKQERRRARTTFPSAPRQIKPTKARRF